MFKEQVYSAFNDLAELLQLSIIQETPIKAEKTSEVLRNVVFKKNTCAVYKRSPELHILTFQRVQGLTLEVYFRYFGLCVMQRSLFLTTLQSIHQFPKRT